MFKKLAALNYYKTIIEKMSNIIQIHDYPRSKSPLKVSRNSTRRPPTPVPKHDDRLLIPIVEEKENKLIQETGSDSAYSSSYSTSNYSSHLSSHSSSPSSTTPQIQQTDNYYKVNNETPLTAYEILRILNGRAHLGVEIPACNY